MARADGDKRPDEVSAMFDDVAEGYDRTNTVLSGGTAWYWRWQTVRALDLEEGLTVLDVAAGTGTSSAAIARTGAQVTALDFSPGMIEVGQRKHPEIEFVEGDATKLPFKANTFDRVTISFGLRNIAQPQKALKEMFRVLKPGGVAVVCEFSTPPSPVMRASYDAYLRHVLPRIASVAGTNDEAYDYLAESIEEWPDQAALSQWMRGAGFGRVAHRNLSGGIVALHRGRKPRKKAAAKAKVAPVETATPEATSPAETEALPAKTEAPAKADIKEPAKAAKETVKAAGKTLKAARPEGPSE